MSNSTLTWPGAREWHDVLIAGLCLDSIGTVACLAMLGYIIIYRQYQSTKDRIIFIIGAASFCFLAFGSLPQRVYVLHHGRLKPLPFMLVFLAYAWWWLLLVIESCLLAYSLHVIMHVRVSHGKHHGSILRPLNITLKAEVLTLIVALGLSFGIGFISALEYRDHCTKTHQDHQGYKHNGITSDNCVQHYNAINWAWISFLSIPLMLQLALWWNVHAINRDIDRLTDASDLDQSSGMAMALERVVVNIVRPLQWYPFIFLFFAALYIVWVVTLYGSDRNEKWANEVGPVTSMAFSLKGLSVACVFFLTQQYALRERPCFSQLMYCLGCPSGVYAYQDFASDLDEALLAERNRYALSESHPDRSSGGGYSLYGEADELDLFATGSSGISGASRSRFDSDYSLRHPSLSGEAEGEA